MAARTGRDLRFLPRPLWRSQLYEIGKWCIKRLGGRGDAFPSWRDLAARELRRPFACETARTALEWKPVEDRRELLDRALVSAEREHG
jgi:hypothetical protein